jgi:hypothetical protein
MPPRCSWILALLALSPAGVQAQTAPEPDGNDDPEDPGRGALPTRARFERVGRGPSALRRICDLTPFRGALYSAHAISPLGSDGATIIRYDPAATTRPFRVAFDWNRPGRPLAGGAAGQGFLRVHNLDGRLFVPDADPPYAGFGFVDPATEGYVFVSDREGQFAPARGERLLPPRAPDASGHPGAAVLPRAYHVLDAIRYRGMTLASTGSVPPRERAWYGPSPGALHVADADLQRWTYAIDYPHPWQSGVWRIGFMVRFRGRLYGGLQDYDGREPNDMVVINAPPGATTLAQANLQGRRVTPGGGALTLRWYAHDGALYWIVWERLREGHLWRTTDGDHWTDVALPPGSGAPTDITRWRDGLVLLTTRGLYRVNGDAITLLATVDRPVVRGQAHGPFDLGDGFCAAPLAVLSDTLYAGSQRDGALWRVVDAAAP